MSSVESSDDSPIVVTRDEQVAIITLNRPEVLNAIDFRLGRDLLKTLFNLRVDQTVRAILITGAGRAFSSGGDVGAMDRSVQEGKPSLFMHWLIRMLNEIVAELRDMRIPVVAAIPGITSGGGLDIAMACDFRIASEKAKFKAAYTGIGLVPAGGGSYLMSMLIGPAKAMEFFLLNEVMEAPEALRLRLVNKIVPHEKLIEEALIFTKGLAEGPTTAFGYTKFLLNEHISSGTLEGHLAQETRLQSQILVETTDFKEGIRAFLEKRPPHFVGK